MMNREDRPSREEIMEIFEAMALIQTLPQPERTALQYYLKGIIAVMTGQLPVLWQSEPTSSHTKPVVRAI